MNKVESPFHGSQFSAVSIIYLGTVKVQEQESWPIKGVERSARCIILYFDWLEMNGQVRDFSEAGVEET